MRGKKAKQLRKAIEVMEPRVLMALRNYYGERTEEMSKRQLYQAAKKLYKRNP